MSGVAGREVPIEDPEEAIHKRRCRGRQQRHDKGFGEDKGRLERPTEAKQEKAGQTKPTSLFHLPGVEPRNAEQEEEAHGRLQRGDDCPCAGGDGRKNVRWMDRLNAREFALTLSLDHRLHSIANSINTAIGFKASGKSLGVLTFRNPAAI